MCSPEPRGNQLKSILPSRTAQLVRLSSISTVALGALIACRFLPHVRLSRCDLVFLLAPRQLPRGVEHRKNLLRQSMQRLQVLLLQTRDPDAPPSSSKRYSSKSERPQENQRKHRNSAPHADQFPDPNHQRSRTIVAGYSQNSPPTSDHPRSQPQLSDGLRPELSRVASPRRFGDVEAS